MLLMSQHLKFHKITSPLYRFSSKALKRPSSPFLIPINSKLSTPPSPSPFHPLLALSLRQAIYPDVSSSAETTPTPPSSPPALRLFQCTLGAENCDDEPTALLSTHIYTLRRTHLSLSSSLSLARSRSLIQHRWVYRMWPLLQLHLPLCILCISPSSCGGGGRASFIATRRRRSSAGRSGWRRPPDWRGAGRRAGRARIRSCCSPSSWARRRTSRGGDSSQARNLCPSGWQPDARLRTLETERRAWVSILYMWVVIAF